MTQTAASRPVEPLNALDLILLSIDETMRESGAVGFETQVLVWLDGRLDGGRLGEALAGLAARHPRLTARLETVHDEPFWRLRPGARCRLAEVDLPTDEPSAVTGFAMRRLGVPRSLADEDPVEFVVLHRPEGRDVLLFQYNHVLMDAHAVAPLMAELERHYRGEPLPEPATVADPLAGALGALPLGERLGAAFQAFDLPSRWRHVQQPTALLGNGRRTLDGPPEYRCVSTSLDERGLQALEARLRRTCGFTSISLALIASAYRVIGARAGAGHRGTFGLSTGAGFSLGLRGAQAPVLGNLASILPFHVSSDELGDRDRLVTVLSERLRRRLHRRYDWGFVQIAELTRKAPGFRLANTRQIVGDGMTFWYAFFGTALAPLERGFCGLGVAAADLVAPGCPPAGVFLIAQKFRGRLALQATYLPELLSDRAASDFLTALVEDLSD